MTLERRWDPTTCVAAALAVIGAAVLISGWHAARPLWVDEEMLALNVRDRSFASLAGPLWLDQSAPLGWLVLERLALLVLGSGERALRVLPLLFALATLGAGVWIARRWLTPAGAAMLLLLCAIGPWMVFFALELKHYSADVFWALFLPALGAWALEAPDHGNALRRRIATWWGVAAAGLWLGNGAAFVTPACASVLFIVSWRRGGWRLAGWTLASGLVWAASAGLSYALVHRHALENAYLQHYWDFAFPPRSAGVIETFGWLVERFDGFAAKPIGSRVAILFWLTSAVGLIVAVATRPALGLMFAMVPLSLAALAVLRLVPPFERLAVWAVPASYLAVALCADAALWLGRRISTRSRSAGIAAGVVTIAMAAAVSVEIAWQGWIEFRARPLSNYRLDDRRSVELLTRVRRPGDAVLTTHFGLPGIWWYAGRNVANAEGTGHWNGSSLFEVGHLPPGRECNHWEEALDAALKGHPRVVVYLGFRLNVLPPGFDTLVLETFGKRGVLVAYRRYAEESLVAVFDLTERPQGAPAFPLASSGPGDDPPAAEGCIAIDPARRW